jgi:hypothetical protein
VCNFRQPADSSSLPSLCLRDEMSRNQWISDCVLGTKLLLPDTVLEKNPTSCREAPQNKQPAVCPISRDRFQTEAFHYLWCYKLATLTNFHVLIPSCFYIFPPPFPLFCLPVITTFFYDLHSLPFSFHPFLFSVVSCGLFLFLCYWLSCFSFCSFILNSSADSLLI